MSRGNRTSRQRMNGSYRVSESGRGTEFLTEEAKRMNAAERMAYEAGKTAKERGLGNQAPCYDPVMMRLVKNARSKAGHEYNARVIKAWYLGAGRELPGGE